MRSFSWSNSSTKRRERLTFSLASGERTRSRSCPSATRWTSSSVNACPVIEIMTTPVNVAPRYLRVSIAARISEMAAERSSSVWMF